MGNVATRLLSLILLLQTRPTWKASELAAELEVSERTVHRYMGMLDEVGVPIYSERGPYGGFSLLRGDRLPPLLFSAEEATVLTMGANLVREVWGQTYGDAVTSALAKLSNVLPDELRAEVAEARRSMVVGGLARRSPALWEGALDVLRHSVRDRRCVRIVYRAYAREDETDRVVEPYAVAFQGGLWYLVGYCRLRQDMRTFRVDRIRQAEPLAEPFTPLAGFDVRDYIRETLLPPPDHQVVARVDAEIAAIMREEHGHWMDFQEQADGSLVARFGVNGLDWPTAWVLGWGGKVHALEPAELVDRVRRAVAEMARAYALERDAAR